MQTREFNEDTEWSLYNTSLRVDAVCAMRQRTGDASRAPARAAPEGGRCRDGACDWKRTYSSRECDVMVCERCGQKHVCSDRTCTLMLCTSDAWLCPVSGRVLKEAMLDSGNFEPGKHTQSIYGASSARNAHHYANQKPSRGGAARARATSRPEAFSYADSQLRSKNERINREIHNNVLLFFGHGASRTSTRTVASSGPATDRSPAGPDDWARAFGASVVAAYRSVVASPSDRPSALQVACEVLARRERNGEAAQPAPRGVCEGGDDERARYIDRVSGACSRVYFNLVAPSMTDIGGSKACLDVIVAAILYVLRDGICDSGAAHGGVAGSGKGVVLVEKNAWVASNMPDKRLIKTDFNLNLRKLARATRAIKEFIDGALVGRRYDADAVKKLFNV